MSGEGSYAGAGPGTTPEGGRPGGGGDEFTGPGAARPPIPPAPGGQPYGDPPSGGSPLTLGHAPEAVPPPAAPPASPPTPAPTSAPVPLLSDGERARLAEGLHGAVTGFVDGPRDSVAGAERVFTEATRLVTEGLARQDRLLGESWKSTNGREQTEELRVALQRYREVTERLLEL